MKAVQTRIDELLLKELEDLKKLAAELKQQEEEKSQNAS
jgi:hypothetical protein